MLTVRKKRYKKCLGIYFVFLIINLAPGPPVIESFKFPKNLQEGGRAQITCAVSSGDMPIYFSWKKDDNLIPSSLQVEPISK